MESIKEAKSVGQIIADVDIEPISHIDNSGREHAMLKLSEKVLQLRGVSSVVLDELLKQHDYEENTGAFAFINVVERTPLDCSKVLSLIESGDLVAQYEAQNTKIEETLEHYYNAVGVADAQEEEQRSQVAADKADKSSTSFKKVLVCPVAPKIRAFGLSVCPAN